MPRTIGAISGDADASGIGRPRSGEESPLQTPQIRSESRSPAPASSEAREVSFSTHSSGPQYNAPRGSQSISTGNGPQFPGANLHGPVYFGTSEQFDPVRSCLMSLAFPEMDSRFTPAMYSRSNDIDDAASRTCDWIFQQQTYKSWASCDGGLLWIKGNPGSGKSTLMRYILNSSTTKLATREGTLVLSSFFHGSGTHLQKTPLGLFRSLLHQLLRQSLNAEALSDLMDTFIQKCEHTGKAGEGWQWHPRELQYLFESGLQKVLETRRVVLFVDALDECGEEIAVKLAEDLEYLLQKLSSRGLQQFRVCFSCRHYPVVTLDSKFEICVEHENRGAISAFVHGKLSSFHPTTILESITNRANGLFLWAWLVVKQAQDLERRGAGLRQINDAILSVPREIVGLYDQLIGDMTGDSLKLVQWICFAIWPLSLDEIRWALLVDSADPCRSLQECEEQGDYPPDDAGIERRVQTLSRGLAEVTSDKQVQFIHQSVRDYFLNKGLSTLWKTTTISGIARFAHRQLSRTCIRYVAMVEMDRLFLNDQTPESYLHTLFPLLLYATSAWMVHAEHGDTGKTPQDELLGYFTENANLLVRRQLHSEASLGGSSDCRRGEGVTLYITSAYRLNGSNEAAEALLRMVPQDGTKDSENKTPFHWAFIDQNWTTVGLLLRAPADIEAAEVLENCIRCFQATWKRLIVTSRSLPPVRGYIDDTTGERRDWVIGNKLEDLNAMLFI